MGLGLLIAPSSAAPRNDARGRGLSPLATFLTHDFYTRLAPIGWAPEALPPVAAMSVSGTQESGFSKVSALLMKILRKIRKNL